VAAKNKAPILLGAFYEMRLIFQHPLFEMHTSKRLGSYFSLSPD
jgi:hypothetical protein